MIKDSFETGKNKLGHNEIRSWHRYVSLIMLAFAMMATIRYHANTAPPLKTMRTLRRKTGTCRSRRFVALQPALPNNGSNPHMSSHGHSGDQHIWPRLRAPQIKIAAVMHKSCSP